MNQLSQDREHCLQKDLDVIQRKVFDLPYAAQSEKQKLDIYLPQTGQKPYPLIIHFHGGAFLVGSKRDIHLRPMLRALKHGFALASVGYRFSSEARFPALIYDAKAAVRFLRGKAQEYHLDENRFAVWGPSAGGYLAAMLGATNEMSAFEDLSMGNESFSSDVQAVVNWCGPAGDFCRMDQQITENGLGAADHDLANSPESLLLGGAIQNRRELSRLAAPITHIQKKCPPFYIVHGREDAIVSYQQSEDLARRIQEVAGEGKATCRIVDSRGHHGEAWFESEEETDAVFRFLNTALN